MRGLRDHLAADVVELSYPATSRLRTLACDVAWYPRLRAPHNVDVLHCPTFRGPFRSRTPLVVTVHDLAVLRHPEWFNRWTRAYSAFAVPRVVGAARRVIAVSEFTKREVVALLGVPEAASQSSRTRSRTSSPPTAPRRTATTSSRSGRSSRARTSRASRVRSTASYALSARVAGVASTCRRTSRGFRMRVTPSSPRSTAARAAWSTRPSTRASASPWRKRSRAAARSSRPQARRWRSLPAQTPSSSIRPTSPRLQTRSRTRLRRLPRRVARWDDVAAQTLAVYEEAVA